VSGLFHDSPVAGGMIFRNAPAQAGMNTGYLDNGLSDIYKTAALTDRAAVSICR